MSPRAKPKVPEVAVPDGRPASGIILADQVKSLDWRARRAKVVDRLGPDVIARTLALLRALL